MKSSNNSNNGNNGSTNKRYINSNSNSITLVIVMIMIMIIAIIMIMTMTIIIIEAAPCPCRISGKACQLLVIADPSRSLPKGGARDVAASPRWPVWTRPSVMQLSECKSDAAELRRSP